MTHQYDSSNNLVGLQYCMVGYSPTWDAFWSVYLTCILIALSATGYGYMISALAPTVEAANALAPPLMVPLLLFGGFFLQSDSVPDYFIWLKYLSWFYYGAENLYVTQWKDSYHMTRIQISNILIGVALNDTNSTNKIWSFT